MAEVVSAGGQWWYPPVANSKWLWHEFDSCWQMRRKLRTEREELGESGSLAGGFWHARKPLV